MATGSSSIKDTSESENEDSEDDKWEPNCNFNPEDPKGIDEKHNRGDNLENETNKPPQLDTDPDQKGETDEGTDAADNQIVSVSESFQDKNGQNITHSNPKGPDNGEEAQTEETKTSIVEADNKKGDNSDSELDYHNVPKSAPLYTQTEQKRTTDEDGEQDESEEETSEEMEKKQNSHVDSELQNDMPEEDIKAESSKTELQQDPALPSVDSENYNSLDDSWVAPSDKEINQLDEDSLESVTITVKNAIRKEVENCRFFQKDTDKLNEFTIELSEHVKKMLQRYCTEEKSVQNNGGAKDVSQTAKSSLKTSEIIPDEISIVEFCIKKQKLESIKKNYKIEVSYRRDGEQIIGWKLSGQTADVKSAAAQLSQFLDGIVVHQEKHIDGGAKSELAKTIQSVEKNGNVLVSKASSERTNKDMVPKREITLHGWRWDERNGKMITLIDGHYSQIDADFILIPKLGLGANQGFGIQPDQSKRHVPFTVKPFDGGKSGGKKHLQDSITSVVKKLMEKQNCKSVCIPLDFAKLVHWQEEQFLKSVIYGLHSILPLKLYFTTGFSANGFERAVEVLDGFLEAVKKEPLRIIVDDTLTMEDSQMDIKIVVCKGNIVESEVDVLVNLTDRGLKLDRGYVSGSILKAAGMAMQSQCNTDYPEGIQFGEVAETDCHKMKNCRKVYHGVLPGWTDIESLTILSSLVRKCLRLANRDGMKSIAFPALGTGRHGYAVNDVARVMIKTILDFDKSYPDNIVKDAQIVCERDACRVFQTELELQVQNHKGARYGKKIRLSPKLKFYLSQADISVHPVDGLVIFWRKNEVFKIETKQYLKEVGRQIHQTFLKNRQKISQCREPFVIKLPDSLPYRYIIHRGVDDYRSMSTAVQAVLQVTEDRKLASVGIVFLSTDYLMLDPASKVLDDFVSSTKQFDKTRKSANLETVYIATDSTKLFDKFVSSVDACLPMESSSKDPKEKSQKSSKLVDITVVGQCEDVQKAVEQLTGKKVQVPKKRATTSTVPANQDEAAGPQDKVSGDKAKKEEPQTKGRPTLERTDEEKCCVILKITDETKMKLDENQRKRNILQSLAPMPILIVHPFNKENEALLKYSSPEDVDRLLKKSLSGFKLSAFQPQALVDLRAYLTPKMIKIINDNGLTAGIIEEHTGAILNRENGVLEGNVLEIQMAHAYFTEIARKCKFENHSDSGIGSNPTPLGTRNNSHGVQSDFSRSTVDKSRSLTPGSYFMHQGSGPEPSAPTSTNECSEQSVKGATCTTEVEKQTFDDGKVYSIPIPSCMDACLRHLFKDLPFDAVNGKKEEQHIRYAGRSHNIDAINNAFAKVKHAVVQDVNAAENTRIAEKFSQSSLYLIYDPNTRILWLYGTTTDYVESQRVAVLGFLEETSYRVLSFPSEQYEVMVQLDKMLERKDEMRTIKDKVEITIGIKDIENYKRAMDKFRELYQCEYEVPESRRNLDIQELRFMFGGQVVIRDGKDLRNLKLYGHDRETVDRVIDEIKERSSEIIHLKRDRNPVRNLEKRGPLQRDVVHDSGNIRVLVYEGNLLESSVDGICNPCPDFVNYKQGLSSIIFTKAGSEVDNELIRKLSGKNLGEVGNCVVTVGGNLKCKHILHAVVPKWDHTVDAQVMVDRCNGDLQKVIMAYLYRAFSIGLSSVALPAICTGKTSGIPLFLCINAYRGCVKKFIQGIDTKKHKRNPGKEIHLVDSSSLKVKLIKEVFSSDRYIPWTVRDAHAQHFYLSTTLCVSTSECDIFGVQADAMAVSHDPRFSLKGHLAKQLLRFDKDNSYRKEVENGKGDLQVTCAPNLTKFTKIFNIRMPVWNKEDFKSSKETFKTSLRRLLKEVDKSVASVVFPVFGGGIENVNDRNIVFESLVEEIVSFSKKRKDDAKSLLRQIHIAGKHSRIQDITIIFESRLLKDVPSEGQMLFKHINPCETTV